MWQNFHCVHAVFLGHRRQWLCDAMSLIHKLKYFPSFPFFQRKEAPVKLATKFLGKESLNSLNLMRMWTTDTSLKELGTFIFSCSQRCVVCRRNLPMQGPRPEEALSAFGQFSCLFKATFCVNSSYRYYQTKKPFPCILFFAIFSPNIEDNYLRP